MEPHKGNRGSKLAVKDAIVHLFEVLAPAKLHMLTFFRDECRKTVERWEYSEEEMRRWTAPGVPARLNYLRHLLLRPSENSQLLSLHQTVRPLLEAFEAGRIPTSRDGQALAGSWWGTEK